MKRSTVRILTTHTGSLPRPAGLIPLLYQPPTEVTAASVQEAVNDGVRRQMATGIDIISDGEQGRIGFHLHAPARLSGFVFPGEASNWMPQDVADYPELQQRLFGSGTTANFPVPFCNGQITMADTGAIFRDIAVFKAALQGQSYTEAFMTSPSPGVLASTFTDHFYNDREAYLRALAQAMRHDYQAIIDAGLLLQVDCPDLGTDRQLRHLQLYDAPLSTVRKHLQQSIDALNAALEGIPSDRVRVHICHSNYPAGHARDVALGDILDLLLSIKAEGLSVVASNSQHRATTYQAIERLVATQDWPQSKVLLVGCIDTLSPVEEHPESVAELLERYAHLIGRENVIACTDCGLATITGVFDNIVPQAAWHRLQVLADGAKLASERLWSERVAV